MPVDMDALWNEPLVYTSGVNAVVEAAQEASVTRVKALACITPGTIDVLLEQNEAAQKRLTTALAALPQSEN